MKSNYGRYIAEREGKQIVEDADGFATYVFLPDYCYIEDIYVVPDKRKSGTASKYADAITVEAKERGYSKLLGSVSPKAAGSTVSMKVLLAYGFELLEAKENVIYLKKDI